VEGLHKVSKKLEFRRCWIGRQYNETVSSWMTDVRVERGNKNKNKNEK
jgi:hypothetical protein